jgi:putative addiction module CopG family antidote
MSREATINISLTPQQLKLVKQRVASGEYHSASELVRESLRKAFGASEGDSQRRTWLKDQVRKGKRNLAAAYKANTKQSLKLAREWSTLNDPWPDA